MTTSERTVRFDAATSEKTVFRGKSGRGTNILSKLFKSISPKNADQDGVAGSEEGDGEVTDSFDTVGTRKTRTRVKMGKSGKSKGSVLAELQAEEAQRMRELQESLNVSERGYLPVHVRTKLLELNGLPATPHPEGSRGVVLFADISGFTNLGKELRSQMSALEAASKLANRICSVLRELTDIVHEFEGDVAKFAGDALLCVWENHDDQWMLERAKACAVSMLAKIKLLDSQLDLHGGIAMGNILHLHLGDKRQELLWYLLTGDAVVRAANLVDEAPRGQILYEPRKSDVNNGSSATEAGGDDLSNLVGPGPLTRLPSVLKYEVLDKNTKTMIMPTHRRQKSREDDEMPLNSPGDPLGQGRRLSARLQDEVMVGEGGGTRTRTSTEDDPFLNMRITPRGRSYIPRALKNILMSGRIESGEMRNRVVALFAALPSLVLGEEEIITNTVKDDRKRLLNDTFAHMSTILRQTDGAFRDLLFDDKGCIFIAVFGAYGAIEMPELKALKAAWRMQEELEVDDLKIGLSVGTCFVGLVGNDVRHDMIVMGHEVNMAARYMAKSDEGKILVSPKIYAMTRDFFDFETVSVELTKHHLPGELAHHPSARRFESHENDLTGDAAEARRDSESLADPNGQVIVYRPLKEKPQVGVNMSSYRYTMVIPDDYFVGRKTELQKLQGHVSKASKDKTGSICIVAGPRGFGKSWLIREFQHKSDEKYSSLLGVAFELYVMTPLYVFRQMFERMFDMYDGMNAKSAKLVLNQWQAANIKFDNAVLDKLFPYMSKHLPQARRYSTLQAGAALSSRFVGKMIGSIRLSGSPLQEEPVNGAATTNGGAGESEDKSSTTLRKAASNETERISSGLVPPNTIVEEIRQSSSNAVPLARSSSAQLQLGSGSPNLDPMSPDGSRRRLISTRNLLDGIGKKSMGSSRDLLMLGANTPSSPNMSAAAQALAQQKAEEDKRKRMLARKASRQEMTLVMGQKEIDPIVKFITALLEHASNEALKKGKKGLLVILEDIQWLDAASLQVLNDLMEKMMANPKSFLPSVYFIASCRNADPDKEDPTAPVSSDMRPLLEQRFLDRAREFKVFNLIELDVLSRDEVDTLMTRLLANDKTGASVSAEVLDVVYNNSGGMPHAVADIFQLIKQNDGSVYLDPHTNQWRWKTVTKDGKHDGGQSVLREARQAFVLRIDNLSLATRDLLKIASCLCDDKQKFRLFDIADVIRLDLDNKSRYLRADTHVPSVDYISNKLQEAVSVGLLKYRKAWVSNVEEWAFASRALAETVLEMVPTDRLNEIRDMKKDIEKEKTGHAAEGLLRDFLGGV